jgi:beta-phosphoglucomutase-like phosphatase (HAD superfamily)
MAQIEPSPIIFFDVRDTLGEVDSPGHLVPYRPSTQKLLEAVKQLGVRTGVITNLPPDVDDAAGRRMVVEAVLSQDPATGRHVTIGEFIARDDIITNHEAGHDKPSREIFAFAAAKLGAEPSRCLFVGENYVECLGAQLAGMRSLLKPCPPGREFLPALQGKLDGSANDSGRQFEALLEHEHLLGERIFAIGEAIADQVDGLVDGKIPAQQPDAWTSPPAIVLPDALRRATAFFVHLIDHFADPVHLRAEEAMAEVAVACGMERSEVQWVFNQHDQARAYWGAIDVAWRRIESGDDDDRFYALLDLSALNRAFVRLFKAHAVRENNQLYPGAGAFFSDADDALVLNLLQHSGTSDITPYIGMVERAEALLGIGGGQ